MPKSARASMLRDVDKARRKNHVGALNKLTEVVDGKRRFVADPPILVPLRDVGADLDEAMSVIESYRLSLAAEHRSLFEKFTLVDIAHKVVGVGSVGTRCWVGLFKGPKHSAEDPLFLQIKEAGPSVLEAYLGRSATGHAGQRVVAGQRMIQTANDVFLGYATDKASGRAVLRPPALGRQGLDQPLAHGPRHPHPLRRPLRLGSRAGALPYGGRSRHRRLPGQGPGLRQGTGAVRPTLCRPERPRPRGRACRRSTTASCRRATSSLRWRHRSDDVDDDRDRLARWSDWRWPTLALSAAGIAINTRLPTG